MSFWIFVALILLVVYLRQLHRSKQVDEVRLKLAKWAFIVLAVIGAVLGLFISIAAASFRWLVLVILFSYAKRYFMPNSPSKNRPRKEAASV